MQKWILIIIFLLVWVHSQAQTVGIGTTTPHRAKLEVQGAVGTTSAIFGGESTGISLQRSWPTIGFNQYYDGTSKFIGNGHAGVQYLDPLNGTMVFDLFAAGTANNICPQPLRSLVLSNTGGLTFGPTAPGYASLAGTKLPGTEATLNLYGSNHLSAFNYGAEENTYIRGGKNNSKVFINDIPGGKTVFTGHVGINTANPAYPLEIRQTPDANNVRGLLLVEPVSFNNWKINSYTSGGVSYLNMIFNSSNDANGYFTSTDGSYFYFSDRRLKTAIKPLDTVMEKVMQLEPVEYEISIDNPQHKKSIGFIAQDLRKHFPQIVSVATTTGKAYSDIPDLHTVNYDGIAVIAVKAIQEQQASIENQGKSIDFVKQRLARLEKRVRDRELSKSAILKSVKKKTN